MRSTTDTLTATTPAPLDAAEFERDGVRYRYLVFEPCVGTASSVLSRSEFDVARRSANGESYRSIARARGTSTHTVANQLARVFRKLGVKGRSELAHALGQGAFSCSDVPAGDLDGHA